MRCFAVLALLICFAWTFGADLPRRGTLNAALRQVSGELLQKYKLAPQSAVQVVPNGEGKIPEGLQDGDIITAIEGAQFTSFAEMNELLRKLAPGTAAHLKVISASGSTETRSVQIIEKPRETSSEYEVIYDYVNSWGHRIRTIVTRPKKEGKYPVLFWIQGINTSSIDQPLTAKNYISQSLLPFAAGGFVTVRVEKPGVGDSEGGPAIDVGFNEELDIYRQALKALDKYAFVDRSRVYVFGHSMGGCHAPILAAEIPVKGIMTYGTVSDSWLEWEIKDVRAFGQLTDEDPAITDKKARETTLFYNELYTLKKPVAEIQRDHPELKQFIQEVCPDGKHLDPRTIQYMVELNDYNFADCWGKIGNARVLALFGENDWISLRHDQEQIPFMVNRSHPGQASFQVVAGSDHLFWQSSSMKDSYQRFLNGGSPYNPEIVKVIKAWITEQEK